MFTLWVQAELDDEEKELLSKYDFENALLIAEDWFPALRKSLRVSLILGVIAWIALYLLLDASAASWITLAGVIAFTAYYYNEIREHIYVRDLIHGRTFRCFSIVELLQKEEYLKALTMYLRQVLESAKHWGGQEAVPIPRLSQEDAKLLVLKSS